MKRIVCALSLLIFAPLLVAQHEHASAPGTARLFEGLGKHHHPIATSSPEAQLYFDQGMAFIYAFNHDEAIRSFRRAAELDPKSPMPYWGIAFGLGPNINLDVDPQREMAAREETDRAKALLEGAPAIERAYVEALDKRYTTDPKANLKQLGRDFAGAMREVSRRFPEDLDAATLYAESLMDLHPWAFWTLDGRPNEDTEEIVRVLEGVLRRDPSHMGANHYYIHAVEASRNPERALPSAARLETLAPAAGHLVHMPAHIYMRTGDYNAAAYRNVVAAEADRAYIQATGAQGVYPLMYYSHNLHFLAAAAMEAGRYADAGKASEQLMGNISPALKQMPMLEFFGLMPLFVQLRFERWQEILAAPQPDESMHLMNSFWHYSRGLAYLGTGDLPKAQAERGAFAASAGQVSPETRVGGAVPESASKILKVAADVLDARIAEARGDRKAALASWRRAVATEDTIAYDEPPIWYYSVRESLGGTLLRDGQAAEAEKVFREDLERHPRSGRSLFGLWQCLKAQNRNAEAAWVEREFQESWKSADVPLKPDDL